MFRKDARRDANPEHEEHHIPHLVITVSHGNVFFKRRKNFLCKYTNFLVQRYAEKLKISEKKL